MKQNLSDSRFNYTNTTGGNNAGKSMAQNAESRIIIYQVILQLHNPNSNESKLPGRLNVKLFNNLNQQFFEIAFTPESQFFRPFLFNEDIIKTTIYIYSDTQIDEIKKLVVEFEAANDHCKFIYLYGIVITNGFGLTFKFPYSNYLADRLEVHLSEHNEWLSYMRRHENQISLIDILPIVNPKYIRLSKIEKIIMFSYFISKFAISPFHAIEYDDIHWSILFALDLSSNFIFYILLFCIHIFYAKRSLIREFFFIKLHFEYLEVKFYCFFILVIVLNNLINAAYDISFNLWKDKLTIDNLRFYEQILINNDLNWVIRFLTSIILFAILTYLFEIYFYKLRKQEYISPGPSNSLNDRLMATTATN